MKEFRFVWNGRVFSKKDTNMILATIVAALIPTLIVLLVLFFAGCHSDNRARIKPTLDYKIAPAKKEMLRLHITRELWAQKQLRDYEKEQINP